MLKLRTHHEMLTEFALRIVKTGEETMSNNTYTFEGITYKLAFTPIRFTGRRSHLQDKLVSFYLLTNHSATPDFYALKSEFPR